VEETMPVALQSVLDDLAPRTLDAMFAEPEVAFDEVQEALHSADRCPATCGACTQGTDSCRATGHTV
jgi:hypothetical protein